MSEASEVSRIWQAIARRWLVVLAAMVIGALVMVGLGLRQAPETAYTSTARVRHATTNLPNMPTVDLLVGFAGSGQAKESAAASGSLDPKGVAVTAASDPKDKQGVVITARAKDAEAAQAWATAVAEQTRAFGLSKLAPLIDLEAARTARFEKRVAQLEAEVAQTRVLAAKAASPDVRAQYQFAVQDLEGELAATEDSLDVSRFTREGYLSYVAATPGSSAAKASGRGILLSDVLRGALVGLFLGALIAALLDRRTTTA